MGGIKKNQLIKLTFTHQFCILFYILNLIFCVSRFQRVKAGILKAFNNPTERTADDDTKRQVKGSKDCRRQIAKSNSPILWHFVELQHSYHFSKWSCQILLAILSTYSPINLLLSQLLKLLVLAILFDLTIQYVLIPSYARAFIIMMSKRDLNPSSKMFFGLKTVSLFSTSIWEGRC